jgi:hypothetical protein
VIFYSYVSLPEGILHNPKKKRQKSPKGTGDFPSIPRLRFRHQSGDQEVPLRRVEGWKLLSHDQRHCEEFPSAESHHYHDFLVFIFSILQ